MPRPMKLFDHGESRAENRAETVFATVSATTLLLQRHRSGRLTVGVPEILGRT